MTEQRLHRAAAEGNVASLKEEIVHKGVSVDVLGPDGRTALHYAASNGELAAVAFLIERKAIVDKPTKFGWTALHCAAQEGFPEVAKHVLDKGADINKRDGQGRTALICAVTEGKLSCVQVLIERKADLTVKATSGDAKGKTALDLADRDNEEMVQLLSPKPTSPPTPAAAGAISSSAAISPSADTVADTVRWFPIALLACASLELLVQAAEVSLRFHDEVNKCGKIEVWRHEIVRLH